MQIFFGMPCLLGAHHYRNRRIHLFRQREGVARCPAEGSRLRETADALRANRGLVPTNEVNFAERPLADIHAKLTKLRDNTVIAMRGLRKRK